MPNCGGKKDLIVIVESPNKKYEIKIVELLTRFISHYITI